MSPNYSKSYITQADAQELQARCAAYEKVLLRIACYDDSGAWNHFHSKGSYSSFDEPYAVQAAHEVLVKFK